MSAEFLAEITELVETAVLDYNNFWLMFGAILVFFMQAGFAMLEVGSVQAKNTRNILIKNILDASIGAIVWMTLGYYIAYTPGAGDNKFIGGDDASYIILNDFDVIGANSAGSGSYSDWFFQYAFAATAATIVSGAIAERVSFLGYIIYSIVLTGFVYPVVVYWQWSGAGWASDVFGGCSVIDFAGSGVVHMTGGIAALVAAFIIGPRDGRFSDDGKPVNLPQQSPVLQTLGVLILWFGWYGFNGVSTLAIVESGLVAAKTMCTTTLSAAAGAVTGLVLGRVLEGAIIQEYANNGVLAGLVSITAGCAAVDPEIAVVIGIIGAIVYYFSSKLLLKLKIDDVVDASPVHFFAGAWGVLAAGLLANEVDAGNAGYAEGCYGLFYGAGADQFLSNLVFVFALLGWVGGLSALLFYGIDFSVGLRIPIDVEREGLDASKHGGMTYPEYKLQDTLAP